MSRCLGVAMSGHGWVGFSDVATSRFTISGWAVVTTAHREMVVFSRKCCHGCVVTDVLSQKCHPQNRDLPTPSVSRQVLFSVTAIYIVLKASSVQRYSYLHHSQGRFCTVLLLFTSFSRQFLYSVTAIYIG